MPSEAADSSEPQGPSTPAEPAFHAATATLVDTPFCSDIDITAAEDLLGVKSGQLELGIERTVGEKYDALDETRKSNANACFFGDSGGKAYLNISVTPDASAKVIEDSLKQSAEFVGAQGQSDKCAVEKETSYGDPGGVVLCTGVNFASTKGRAGVTVLGLAGSSEFSCGAGVTKGVSPEQLEKPTRDFCAEVLEQLATAS